MKSPLIASVSWLLLVALFGLYVYGMMNAIELSWGNTPISGAYNDVLSAKIGSIQAFLLTNLGILLGLSIVNPDSKLASHLLLNQSKGAVPTPLDVREKVQLVALLIFILSLIACLITWAAEDFTSQTEQMVSVVSSSGKMFIGVALAYLTAVFK